VCDPSENCESCPEDCGSCTCPAGKIHDCNGECTLQSYLGDGECDSQFDCAQFNEDGGDCTEPSVVKIRAGSYLGNGVSGRVISGVGFRPDVLFVKAPPGHAVLATDTMGLNKAMRLFGGALETGGVSFQEFEPDGFRLGGSDHVNGNDIVYHYLALTKESGALVTGTYTGDDTFGRLMVVGFKPDLVLLVTESGAGISRGCIKPSTLAGDAAFYAGYASVTDCIEALVADGFQVKENGNKAGSIYHYVALRNMAEKFQVGTYQGTGTDYTNVGAVGFSPSAVWIKNATASEQYAVFRQHSQLGDLSDGMYAHDGPTGPDLVQVLQADGFQVGTNAAVNATGNTYHYMAFRDTVVTPQSVNDGGYVYGCTLLVGGAAKCWGSNYVGQRGDGTILEPPVATTVLGITTATTLSSGQYHSCALLSAGTVSCWGYNASKQLGNGALETDEYKTVPVVIPELSSGVISLVASDRYNCVLLADKTVKWWGHGDATPVLVPGLSNVAAIATASDHVCVRLTSGVVKCWGYGTEGELGNGMNLYSAVPVTVVGLTMPTALGLGDSHSCAVLVDGSVKCWGRNASGQVGDGTNFNASTPVVVSGITNARDVAGGWEHTCSVLVDGAVWCWGKGDQGQLGDGMMANSSVPVQVSGITNAVAIGLGSYKSCATLSDRTVKCWGGGDGTPMLVSGVP
jgi:hypothetical protein